MFVFISPKGLVTDDRARLSSIGRIAHLFVASRRLDRRRLARSLVQLVGLVWIVAAILVYPVSQSSRQCDARQMVTRLGGSYNVGRNLATQWLPEWLMNACGGDNLYPVESINLSHCDVRDEDLEMLLQFPRLEQVNLCGCHRVTHAGVAKLKRLRHLKLVWVNGMSVEDAGSCLTTDLVAASGR
jgi:hypothetical protein